MKYIILDNILGGLTRSSDSEIPSTLKDCLNMFVVTEAIKQA